MKSTRKIIKENRKLIYSTSTMKGIQPIINVTIYNKSGNIVIMNFQNKINILKTIFNIFKYLYFITKIGFIKN